jgi:hypothetical protein
MTALRSARRDTPAVRRTRRVPRMGSNRPTRYREIADRKRLKRR